MKSKIIFPVLIAVMMASSFSNKAEALSCAQTFPVVGTIDTVTKEESYSEILLDNVYTFDTSDFTTNQIISIDRYVNTVDVYVKNNFRLSEKPQLEYSEWVNKISLSTKVLDKISLQKGDIIITGPQFYVCSYGFSGLFTRSGKLQYAAVNDSYGDYSYGNSKLIVEAGKELECDKNDRCKMEVNYQLDGKSFRLSPGQSYTPTRNLIKSITLLDSSDFKQRSDDTTMFDWGMGTYVNHIISFQDSEIKSTPIPTPTPTPTPNPTPASTPEPSPEPVPVEKLSVFQKIWYWFVSLFE
ncbi:hypothetical protein A2814_00700 [Candidatus Nomurabacteria bacterium RIFCSPHIGHO2_01_FULL_38_19]|uniref:Uncharacterized protein n=1 Tax=Candidatus Nomurabacteria bacterium RIFCSPHIGHO2_01_FULL_38_19 TaxID=1801732 RepID=A0A1F6UVB6_9BACT|nr:MAG: hypothetical protein A2814_00700 [Candidatus Nomurabacteria bacterium RIFCSPHIGHO2_01_FULL_38_19]